MFGNVRRIPRIAEKNILNNYVRGGENGILADDANMLFVSAAYYDFRRTDDVQTSSEKNQRCLRLPHKPFNEKYADLAVCSSVLRQALAAACNDFIKLVLVFVYII